MWIISFWLFPVISACMWVSMLIAMIAKWAVDGYPHYPWMGADQDIAYISDIGASWIKPLFIAGGTVTVVLLDLAFLSERWLRHAGQLVPNRGWLDKGCAILSIFFSIGGALGMILLTSFDARQYPHKHDGFLIMFLFGYVLSAVCLCIEYFRLGIFYRTQHRVLYFSAWIKLAFIVIEVPLAIAFGVEDTKGGSNTNISAVLEWVVAFIFTFYVLSFVIDLLPAVRTKNHVPQGHKRLEMAQMHAGNRHRNNPYDAPLDLEPGHPPMAAIRSYSRYRRGH